ncbi:MAG: hypothetical protein EPO38_12410 [Rhizorhabdus sp.]|jgi:hypothetical protein|nr:MAG: hypothetical protein EPO38_12410 [Rhizorhabdus sp.]
MNGFAHAPIIGAALLFPFVAMPLLWRRMKRVRDEAYRASKTAPPPPDWEESVATHDGLNVVRVNQPNDELIALGDRARHSNWPINTL